MRRAPRLLFDVVTLLSAVLSAATLALWDTSYWRTYVTRWRTSAPSSEYDPTVPRVSQICARTGLGRVAIEFLDTWDHGAERGFSADTVGAMAVTDERGRTPRFLHALGFRRFRPTSTGPGTAFLHWSMPILWATAVLAALPAVWVVRRRARVRAVRRSPCACLSCGYDLRATPGRCPECGAVPIPLQTRN